MWTSDGGLPPPKPDIRGEREPFERANGFEFKSQASSTENLRWRWGHSASPRPSLRLPTCLDHYGGSAEDPQRGVLVFFGGHCIGAIVEWDGNAWKEATSNPTPANRGDEAGRPAMAYDPDHRIVLVFGGHAQGSYFNDLWAWDGAGWTKIGSGDPGR